MEKLKNLFMKDEQGQVGIGTLIIFIAMVLVAAVAAAVLIQTSGNLQQRAQSTGEEATDEVSSNFNIRAIEGIRGSTGDSLEPTIDHLLIRTGISAGGDNMDLSQLIVTISDSNKRNVLKYNESTSDSFVFTESKDLFTAEAIRDEDNTFLAESPVMNRGDLVTLSVSTLKNPDVEKVNGIQREGTADNETITTESISGNETFELDNIGVNSTNTHLYNGTGDEIDSGYTVYESNNSIEINGSEIVDDPDYSLTYNYSADWVGSDLELNPRTDVKITLTPESGTSKILEFMTPASYGVDTRVSLYP